MLYKICSKQIYKYSGTLNYLLETTLFPTASILKLFLSLFDPVYKTCLNVKQLSKFSLVQDFLESNIKVFTFHYYAHVPFSFS